MKRLSFLLGSSDRSLNTRIEVAAHDVCYNHATLNCLKSQRLDEVLATAARQRFDLALLAFHHLSPGKGLKVSRVTSAQALEALSDLQRMAVPVVVLSGESPEIYLEAGAESVFPVLFNTDLFKSELKRILVLPDRIPTASDDTERFTLAGLLARGVQRLRHA